MQVDRDIQGFRLGEDRFERRGIEKAPVRGTVHQHAMKAEVFDGAFQLSGRFARRMQRQMREAAITGVVARAGLRQRVVVGRGDVDARLPGTRSAPGPATDSTCMVMPLASMSFKRAAMASGELPATMRGQ
jgi:hypothetical protein